MNDDAVNDGCARSAPADDGAPGNVRARGGGDDGLPPTNTDSVRRDGKGTGTAARGSGGGPGGDRGGGPGGGPGGERGGGPGGERGGGPGGGPGGERGGGPAPVRVRLLVVDDHPVVRSGIVGMLSGEEDLLVVGEASDGQKAVDAARELRPDVVLMDLRMPGMDGVEATRRVLAGGGAARVVVLTTYDTDGDILRAVEAGAIGYLLKDCPREDILAAVRAAAVGRSTLSPSVTTRLVGATRGAGAGAGRRGAADGLAGGGLAGGTPVTLSPRECEVLTVAARGLSNAQIGVELYITEATVKTHLLRAYKKLGVDTRTAAVTEALRRGLLDLD